MAVELKPLNELPEDDVAQNKAEAAAFIEEANPALDLRPGPFHALLVHFHALLATQRQQNIRDYLSARSLRALEADPELADDELVDDAASNFNVRRRPGSRARGDVTVVVSDDVTVVVGVGAVFEAQGKRFLTERVFTAKAEEEQVVGDGDRLLRPTADGNWAFTVEVVAEAEGADFEVRKGAPVVPAAPPANYVTSYAAADFRGGLAPQTNRELLDRLQEGYAAKAPSNRVNMFAMLRGMEEFARVGHMSVIGYGDPEMLRDRHTIWPISLGGRADWYVRTQERLLRQPLVREATLVGVDADGFGFWQFSVPRDAAPGFYALENVRLPAAEGVVGGFEVTAETRGVDLSGLDYPAPDVATAAEGAYSRFQTAVVRFKDTVTRADGLPLGAKQEYTVEAVGLPLVGEIQDAVSARGVRGHASDCLVKAPVPCFVQLHFAIHKQAGAETPPLDDIRDALCAEVNGVAFIGRLYASRLHDAVHGFLRDNTHASALDMFGRIRQPDGTIIPLRSTEVLEVPDAPADMVSPRTVQFFISPEDVTIDVVTSVPLN